MGLTFQSTQNSSMTDIFKIDKKDGQYVIALAGNPNTGKSTVFNALTGLHQHTGNWPGKTVVNARGEFTHNGKENILVDLPGTYSLFASSVEEEVARDFICFGNSDAVIVVTDATCLERNLNLVYQVMELTDNVVLCINLIDEAKKKHIEIDGKGIEKELGIPVVLCAARSGVGIKELKETLYQVTIGNVKPKPKSVIYSEHMEEKIKALQPLIEEKITEINSRWLALRFLDGDKKIMETMFQNYDEESFGEIQKIANSSMTAEAKRNIRDDISQNIYKKAEEVSNNYVIYNKKNNRDRKIDNIITSRIIGIPLMLLVLALVFWITISGANVPSAILADLLFGLENKITQLFQYLNAPAWLHGLLVLGMFRTFAWVVSVMLPPMAIFFPLFTILEDLGYLPRVAFNMDHLFKKACAHGKQCLTMCMVKQKL